MTHVGPSGICSTLASLEKGTRRKTLRGVMLADAALVIVFSKENLKALGHAARDLEKFRVFSVALLGGSGSLFWTS